MLRSMAAKSEQLLGVVGKVLCSANGQVGAEDMRRRQVKLERSTACTGCSKGGA